MSKMYKRFLVTGGAGFIGSNLVDYMLEQDCNVVVVDDLSTGNMSNLSNAKDSCLIIESKIENFDWELVGKIDGVVHLAAQASVPFSIENFKTSSFSNLLGSINVIDFCRLSNIPLIYASSAATYGMGEFGFEDSHEIVESLKPLNPYGESKHEFDKWVLKQNEKPPFWAGLKFFNVFGPNEYHKSRMASVIFHTFNQIKATGGMKLFRSHNADFKDGAQLRDFIYVKDVIRFIYKSLILAIKKPICEKINVLTGKSISINKLADVLMSETGTVVEKIYELLPEGDPKKSDGTVKKMLNLLTGT